MLLWGLITSCLQAHAAHGAQGGHACPMVTWQEWQEKEPFKVHSIFFSVWYLTNSSNYKSSQVFYPHAQFPHSRT